MGKNDFCCAPNCSNNRKRNPSLKYYRIPKEAKCRKAWLDRIRQKHFAPTDNSRLCSEHFVSGEKSEVTTHEDNPSVFAFNSKKKVRTTRTSQRIAEIHCESTPKRKQKSSKKDECKGRPKPSVESIDDHKVWRICLTTDHPLKEHDYCKSQSDPRSNHLDEEILIHINKLESKVDTLQKKNEQLRSKCLLLDTIKADDDKFQHWTSFPNYGTFKSLFDFINAVGLQKKKVWRGTEMIIYGNDNDAQTKRGSHLSKLKSEEEVFMVFVRVRAGLTITDLSQRFSVSESSVSKLFATWINSLYFHLKELCQMSEFEENGKAKQFSSFPDLKVIVDCTEIFTQKPSSLTACRQIYSNYKSHTTFKYLVAINSHGAVVYVSRAWGGRTSDKHITANSADFLATLKPGDELMADRGFDIQDVVQEKGAKLTIPDFKGTGRSQMKCSEGKRSEKIAEARIHVERVIQRIKTYQILSKPFPLSMAHLADQIFGVCAYLVNFQSPILRQ